MLSAKLPAASAPQGLRSPASACRVSPWKAAFLANHWRGLVPLGWHQSSACTLATLSSSVCSLSVRVLIFTVV
jgi:hypothetical protein